MVVFLFFGTFSAAGWDSRGWAGFTSLDFNALDKVLRRLDGVKIVFKSLLLALRGLQSDFLFLSTDNFALTGEVDDSLSELLKSYFTGLMYLLENGPFTLFFALRARSSSTA